MDMVNVIILGMVSIMLIVTTRRWVIASHKNAQLTFELDRVKRERDAALNRGMTARCVAIEEDDDV